MSQTRPVNADILEGESVVGPLALASFAGSTAGEDLLDCGGADRGRGVAAGGARASEDGGLDGSASGEEVQSSSTERGASFEGAALWEPPRLGG
mmetsp:Transcript_50965/g.135952  ORF Transcript_50965/g.135952 Transcript_50965/m.135952 type:complete len:94 (-) Transcript_50965:1275-1556(-)